MITELKYEYKINGIHIEKLWIITIYRIGNFVYYSNMPDFTKKIFLLILNIIKKIFVEFIFHVEIPFKCKIGLGLRLMHPQGIVIHKNVEIGKNCTIFHQVTIGSNEHSENPNLVAKIGNNVYIGCGAKIIGNVIIGDNSKIGANAVVVKDILTESTVYSKQTIIKK